MKLPREEVVREQKAVTRQPWTTPTFRVKAEHKKIIIKKIIIIIMKRIKQ